jgi:prepilin-type N-terminal cleavage/methylation domain-containing protein
MDEFAVRPPLCGGRAGRRRAGLTLIECAIVCAVVAVMAALALPMMRSPALRVARLDAMQSLMRLQAAQEQHRSLHGLYAADLQPLRGVNERSAQGLYRISLAGTGPDAYRASAVAQGAQARDTDCPTLTLEVHLGFAQEGPSPACWNR